MSNIWRQVDTGGRLTITKYRKTSDGSEVVLDLENGVGVEQMGLEVSNTSATFNPIGQRSPSRRRTGVDFRISSTRGLEDSSALETGQFVHSMQALLVPAVAAVYATYKNANGTTLFAGWCLAVQADDNSRSADFARQSLSLVSAEDPDVPAGV